MNEIQKELVSSLYSTGLGYKAIAGRLGISRDTVRSYLRYHKDEFATAASPCGSEEAPTLCFYCGAPLKHMDHRKLIKNNPRWENAGIFADYGLTGTKTTRPGFQGLLKLCEEGKVDLVLTKSISRFCRNTVDLLTTVRHLKDLDINVHFSSENIDSISSEGELLLSLLAEFATQQSRSISENTRWAIHKRFEKGIPHSVNLYGFNWDGSNFSINQEQAAVVREIFSEGWNRI